MSGAAALYKRLIELEPSSAIFCNYGQVLAAQGQLKEAEEQLLKAYDGFLDVGEANLAELCLSLWLVSQMKGYGGERWERAFKFMISLGFTRSNWSFDALLEQAAQKLSKEEFEYAKALVAAFHDETKVRELEKDVRWQQLEPLHPSNAEMATDDGDAAPLSGDVPRTKE
jgi:tetratricopeptide (TPR) repeat protein